MAILALKIYSRSAVRKSSDHACANNKNPRFLDINSSEYERRSAKSAKLHYLHTSNVKYLTKLSTIALFKEDVLVIENLSLL